jgi:hypothetical protein
MRPVQFSTRNLLWLVAYLAVGLAAVIYDRMWVGSVAVLGYAALVCLAIVGAIVRRGAAQVFWLGTAVFGSVYFLLMSLLPHVLPSGALAEALGGLQRAPQVGDLVEAQWTSGNYYPARLVQYSNGQFLAAWTDGDRPLWVTRAQIRGRRVYRPFLIDAFLGPLFALAGAVLCRRVLGAPATKPAAQESDRAA